MDIERLAEVAVDGEARGLAETGHRPGQRGRVDDAVVGAGGLDHFPAFEQIVADRLLDEHMFAGLRGVDAHQRVPVVRRGDPDRIDILTLQQFPVVGEGLGLLVMLGALLKGVAEIGGIDIAERRDPDARHGTAPLHVVPPHAADLDFRPHTDDGQPDGIVRALSAEARGGGQVSCRANTHSQETPTIHIPLP